MSRENEETIATRVPEWVHQSLKESDDTISGQVREALEFYLVDKQAEKFRLRAQLDAKREQQEGDKQRRSMLDERIEDRAAAIEDLEQQIAEFEEDTPDYTEMVEELCAIMTEHNANITPDNPKVQRIARVHDKKVWEILDDLKDRTGLPDDRFEPPKQSTLDDDANVDGIAMPEVVSDE